MQKNVLLKLSLLISKKCKHRYFKISNFPVFANKNFAFMCRVFAKITFCTFLEQLQNFMCRVFTANPKNCLPCDGFSEKKIKILHFFFEQLHTFFIFLCVVFCLQIRKTAYRVMVFLKKKSKFCTFFCTFFTPFIHFFHI